VSMKAPLLQLKVPDVGVAEAELEIATGTSAAAASTRGASTAVHALVRRARLERTLGNNMVMRLLLPLLETTSKRI